MRRVLSGSWVICLVLFSSCTDGPRKIEAGLDVCAHCRMTITDMRFASQLVTSHGKQHPFDSIECLAWYLEENPVDDEATYWVNDYNNPGDFIEAETAVYVTGPEILSPMAANLAAFPLRGSADSAQVGATRLSMDEAFAMARAINRAGHEQP